MRKERQAFPNLFNQFEPCDLNARRKFFFSFSKGSSKLKMDPFPTTEVTEILLLWPSRICLTMAKPSEALRPASLVIPAGLLAIVSAPWARAADPALASALLAVLVS